VTLSADLEDWLGRKFAPSLAYEHPTIDALAEELWRVISLGESVDRQIGNGDVSAQQGAAEDFDLHDFVSSGVRLPLRKRVARFLKLSESHRAGYRREVLSAAGREVEVINRATGRPQRMLMFGSNNYLGLATHPHVRERVARAVERFGVGLGGAPLFSGYTVLHRELEERLAALKHAESTLIFSTGFAANCGIAAGLVHPRRSDAVVFDELSHASWVDGVKLSGGHPVKFRHNDVGHLEETLDAVRQRYGDVFVGVEGVYSMDGDLAPLDRMVPLCKSKGALLIVDDAHGTGVLGPTGSGTASHFGVEGLVDITMGTFSKAFGVVGAFVCASQPLIEYLRYFARSYVFSTSLPPIVVSAVLAGLDVLEREPELVAQLRDNVRYTVAGLKRFGLTVTADAAIITLLLPVHRDMVELGACFERAGLFVNVVQYPAVPVGQQRLRISLMATHTRADIDRLLGCVEEVWSERPIA
jgi:glycine C-acetyltransferase